MTKLPNADSDASANSESSHVFLGRKKCGHAVYVAVDEPDMATEIGKDVARLVRDGRAVDRLTIEAYRALGKDIWLCNCPVTSEEQKIRDREEKRRRTRERRTRLGLRR